jgi:hypothetical protein
MCILSISLHLNYNRLGTILLAISLSSSISSVAASLLQGMLRTLVLEELAGRSWLRVWWLVR